MAAKQFIPKRLSIVLLLVLMLTGLDSSAHISHDIGDYTITQWTTKHGLPSNVLRDLVQDEAGFLWVATLSGLARFDGFQFENFDLTNTPELGSTQILQVVSGSQGRVWILPLDQELVVFQNEEFHRVSLPDGQLPTALLKTADGKICVGTSVGLVFLNNGVVESVHPLSEVNSLEEDEQHRLWVQLRPNESQSYCDIVCLINGHENFRASVPLPVVLFKSWADLGLVVANIDSLSLVLPGGIHTVPTGQMLSPEFLRIGFSDTDRKYELRVLGSLYGPAWVGGANGLYRISPPSTETPDSSMSPAELILPDALTGYIRTLIEDKNGTLWVGTETGGIFSIEPSIAQPIELPAGWDIETDSINKVPHIPWLHATVDKSPEANFLLWNLAGTKIIPLKEDIILQDCFAMEEQTRRLNIFSEYQPQSLTNGVFKPSELPTEFRRAIWRSKGPEGHIWYTDGEHLIRWSNTVTDTISPCNQVFQMTSEGAIWFQYEETISQYFNGSIESYDHLKELPNTRIRDKWIDPQGRLWLGYHGSGLACLMDGQCRVATMANGLPDNTIGGLLGDENGRLWANSNRGIFVIEASVLEQFAKGESDKLPCRLVTKVEAGDHWAAKGNDGRLYFNSLPGVVGIDPDKLPPASPPPTARIMWIKYNDKKLTPRNNLTLPRGTRNFSIGFTAPALHNTGQVRFRYKLGNVSDGWQNIGLRREVFFTHIPPGNYSFEIIAAGASGIWATTGDTFTISLPAYYYEQTWFKVLIVMALFGFPYLLYRIRTEMKLAHLHEIEKESERRLSAENSLRNMGRRLINAQEEERRRIARELHDDVNQRLAVLAMELDLMESGRSRTPADLALFVQELAGDIHHISHSLHPSRIGQMGLAKALVALCQEMDRDSSRDIIFESGGNLDNISAPVSLCLFRIAQESVHNAIKYSKSPIIRVSLGTKDQNYVLSISDDGIGFDTQDLSGYGLGLSSMTERVGWLGGYLDIQSAIDNGTTITAKIPVN